jgi:hypothetical protein
MANPDFAALNKSASARLRDTAQWLVGGVTAAIVGVLAGSSLTKLGSLDFVETPGRLGLAIFGGALGFGGLAWIMQRALAVLTVESFSFESFVKSANPQHRKVSEEVTRRLGRLPGGALDLEDLMQKVGAARAKESENRIDPESRDLLAKYRTYRGFFMPEAAFGNVQAKFNKLVSAIRIGLPVSILGLGFYVWAANPPEAKESASKPAPITVIGPQEVIGASVPPHCTPLKPRPCTTPMGPLIDK